MSDRFLKDFCDWFNDPKTWKKPKYTIRKADRLATCAGGIMLVTEQGIFICNPKV